MDRAQARDQAGFPLHLHLLRLMALGGGPSSPYVQRRTRWDIYLCPTVNTHLPPQISYQGAEQWDIVQGGLRVGLRERRVCTEAPASLQMSPGSMKGHSIPQGDPPAGAEASRHSQSSLRSNTFFSPPAFEGKSCAAPLRWQGTTSGITALLLREKRLPVFAIPLRGRGKKKGQKWTDKP